MIAALMLQALAVTADPEAAGMSRAALKNAAGILEERIRSGDINAASILVSRRGKVVLHSGFGRLSAGGSAVKPDSVYLLASITKPVSACALMLLVERGRVSLNDPVKRYLPEFHGGEKDKVVVRDLLA